MNDFIFHNPDRVYFGRNQLEYLPGELLQFGRKVLLVYGGGSIKGTDFMIRSSIAESKPDRDIRTFGR